MNEKTHTVRPPYNVHVGFFIHTSRKRKKKNTEFLKETCSTGLGLGQTSRNDTVSTLVYFTGLHSILRETK